MSQREPRSAGFPRVGACRPVSTGDAGLVTTGEESAPLVTAAERPYLEEAQRSLSRSLELLWSVDTSQGSDATEGDA